MSAPVSEALPLDRLSGLYVIRNRVTGMVYVGATGKPFRLRWRQHRRFLRLGQHNNARLQNSWNHHGEAAFEFSPLMVLDPRDRSAIAEMEERAIAVMKRTGCAFNSQLSSAGFTQEVALSTREKLSRAAKGRRPPDHVLAASLEARRRKVWTPEERRRWSAARKGLKKPPRTEQHLRLMGEAHVRQFPSFVSPAGEVTGPVTNLTRFCAERGLAYSAMWNMARGWSRSCCGGWRVA